MKSPKPLIFVVHRTPSGRLSPALYHDEHLPAFHDGIVFRRRLDTLPNGAELTARPHGDLMRELFSRFLALQELGALPGMDLYFRNREEVTVSFKFSCGEYVQDIVTGVTGVITGRADFITGCNRYPLQPPPDENGQPPGDVWFDETRLEYDPWKLGKRLEVHRTSEHLPG